MESKKNYTPIKVLLSYVALLALVVTVGWILYSENVVYNKLEDKIAFEKTKILKVSKLFSNIYKTESLGRKTIQTNSPAPKTDYFPVSSFQIIVHLNVSLHIPFYFLIQYAKLVSGFFLVSQSFP